MTDTARPDTSSDRAGDSDPATPYRYSASLAADIESQVKQSVAAGAQLLTGGKRLGARLGRERRQGEVAHGVPSSVGER